MQHVGVAPGVASRGGIFDQGGVIISVERERAIEPGQGGGEAVAAAHDLPGKDDGGKVRRIECECLACGDVCATNVARVEADAAEIGVGISVTGRAGDERLEHAGGGGNVARGGEGAGAHADRVSGVGRRRACGLRQRALRIALHQPGVGEQVVEARSRDAVGTGTVERPFSGGPIAQQQIDAPQQCARHRPVRALGSGDRMVARGAVIATRQRGEAGL